MSTITPAQPVLPIASQAQAPPLGGAAAPALKLEDVYRMTVDEYERIGGMLEDDRIELIDGYLVKKMSKKPPHVATVKRIYGIVPGMLPVGWTWQKEDPVRIPDFDEPEPDVAVLRGSNRDYDARIPDHRDVVLAVEVAETTLDRDRGPKLLAFARGGIPVYWIVNLVDSQIEVYSDPSPDGYRSRQDFQPGQVVPVIIGGAEVGRIGVSDILP
jgi:Uma2 family endonuclease